MVQFDAGQYDIRARDRDGFGTTSKRYLCVTCQFFTFVTISPHELQLMKKGQWSSTKAMGDYLHGNDDAKQQTQPKRIKRA